MGWVAVVCSKPRSADPGLVALVGDGVDLVGTADEILPRLRTIDDGDVRWVTWEFATLAPWLLGHGVRIARAWDLAEAHRVLHGGWAADPARVWASAAALDPAGAPAPPTGDLFDFASAPDTPQAPDALVRTDGYLRADAATPTWLSDPEHLRLWARAALTCAERQSDAAGSVHGRAQATCLSESATAVLAAELGHDGLPIDRAEAVRIIESAAGPRPTSEEHARAIRAERDSRVTRHLPAGHTADLRNPGSVKAMLELVGIRVESTRKWELDRYRDVHPIVPALLAWRADERIATTYGHRWLQEHVGSDDRLRGGWTVCDGAAGRMTAQNGLHNLPAVLRTAVAAEVGHVLVRADLGQIEPRVLAVVAQDPAFAEATRADDLYAPVATRLAVDRSVAKVAVLAAMYGQRSGAAGEALKGLEAAYPTSMRLLDEAYERGRRGEPIRTYGGRLVRTDYAVDSVPIGSNPAMDNGRGRFARNAIIQGSAAELFKAWAATVRATTRHLGARIVLCLHDEILIHVPESAAEATVSEVHQSLTTSARRWSGTDRVRFVADVSVVRRWSEAKD